MGVMGVMGGIRVRNILAAVALIVCTSSVANANLIKVWGWAEKGGQAVNVGPYITKQAQRSYPGATITVYAAGTSNLSTIYISSAGVGTKSNPFTADANGYWWFYSDDATYDIQISGSGFSTYTLSDVSVVTSVASGACATCVTTDTTQSITGVKTFSSSAAASNTFTASLSTNTTPSLRVLEHPSGQSGVDLFAVWDAALNTIFSVDGTTGLVNSKSITAAGRVAATAADGAGNALSASSSDTDDPALLARSSADSSAKFQALTAAVTDATVVIAEESPTGQAANTKMLDVRNQDSTSIASIDAEGDLSALTGTFINGSTSTNPLYAYSFFSGATAAVATSLSGISLLASAAANTNTAATVDVREHSGGQAANTHMITVRDQSAASVASIDAEGDITGTSIVAATGVIGGGSAAAGKELDVNGDFEATTGNITGVLTVGSCVGCGTASLPVSDTTSIVEGSADVTKEVRFEVDGLTTGTTRVITVPDTNLTLAGTNVANTFTGLNVFNTAGQTVNIVSSSAASYALDVDATGGAGAVAATVTGTAATNAGYFGNQSNNAGATIGVYADSYYGHGLYAISRDFATEAAAVVRHENSTANTRVLELQNHLGTAVAYIDREGDATFNNLTVNGTAVGVVTTTGAQNVAGVKTFTNQIEGTSNAAGDGAIEGTSTVGYGVEGVSSTGVGVHGSSGSSGYGVQGSSTSGSSAFFEAAAAGNTEPTVLIKEKTGQAIDIYMLEIQTEAAATVAGIDVEGDMQVNSISIGTGGLAVAHSYTASTTYDGNFAATATNYSTTLTVTGSVVGQPCFAGLSTLTVADVLVSCSITAADTATVNFYNVSGGAVNPASGNLRVTVLAGP